MKTAITTVLLGIFVALHAGAAFASTSLNSSRSNVNKAGARNGPAVKGFGNSANVVLSGPSDTQTVYTVAADPTEFILTEFCSSAVTGGVELDVAGFGFIAQTSPDHLCYTFSGVEIPGGLSGQTLTCSTGPTAPAGSYSCRISGILMLK